MTTLVVAAKGGFPQDPAWAHNLRANPDAEVELGAERVAVRAREANLEERRRLWPRTTAYNPLWGRYQQRTERTIPLFTLQPKDSGSR